MDLFINHHFFRSCEIIIPTLFGDYLSSGGNIYDL